MLKKSFSKAAINLRILELVAVRGRKQEDYILIFKKRSVKRNCFFSSFFLPSPNF